MGQTELRKCVSCGERFTPDARNARHQRYCTGAPCKAASKRASQAKWLAKPENQDYHRGAEAVTRVRVWRLAHPGYSRRKAVSACPTDPEHEDVPMETAEHAPVPVQNSCNAPPTPLQDLLNAQPLVLVGLIAHVWGSALQDAMPHSALHLLCRTGNYAARGLADRRHAGL